MFLEKINSTEDLKNLKIKDLDPLCKEIRDYLIETVTETGGHLSSNLGVVELTVALHHVFDAPSDKIIFDVGHQAYTHKILTGRREAVKSIRQEGGISGFPKISESVYDAFGTGHSSTALSAALGMAKARDLSGGDNAVIAVVGDGAMTGGMALEALNDIGAYGKPLIIVLNDNKMSISKNVGAMSRHFGRLRIKPSYRKTKRRFKRFLRAIPLIGKGLDRLISRFKEFIKRIVLPGTIFGPMGIKYVGPIKGHNIEDIIDCLKNARGEEGPVLLHIVTKKGKGMAAAEDDPARYHGVNGNGDTGGDTFSAALGRVLCDLAEKDDKICAITAGMADGTGLVPFREKYPARFFDAGIAEQHAVTMAAGLAAAGYKPFAAIYSTFLQRAFDQVLHDAALQKLPVKIMIDRAGVAGADGSTHQGIYDIAYLSLMPDMTLLAPCDTSQLKKMAGFAAGYPRPICIRYPKNCKTEYPEGDYALPEYNGEGGFNGALWQTLKTGTDKVTLLCAGNRMLDTAFSASEILGGRADINIVNACFIMPLDHEYLEKLYSEKHTVITMEDGILDGGFGAAVLNYYNRSGRTGMRVITRGIEEKSVPHGKIETAFIKSGLSGGSIADLILSENGRA